MTKPRTMPEKRCDVCDEVFTKRPKASWDQWQKQRTCSNECSAQTKALIDVIDRIARKSVPQGGCLVWEGATTPKGDYGVIGVGSKAEGNALVHRIVYEHHFGLIPVGYEVDHRCRVTLCVKPIHLEAVTKAENLRRQQEAITHCIRGHAFTEENIYRPPKRPTRRYCRECIKIRGKRTKRW